MRGLSRLAFFSALGAGIVAGCSSDLGSEFGNGGPCATLLADQCGGSCGSDVDCPSGLFCQQGSCFAECTQDGGWCGPNETCSDSGRCSSVGMGGDVNLGSGGAGGSGATSGAGGACAAVEIAFEPQTPTVVLLIDQSGSMTAGFNNQGSRWDVVYDALMDPQNGVVKQLEGQVRFALALYTYQLGNTCPQLVEVGPPKLTNFNDIDATYSQQVPLSNTPTGDSLAAITPDLAAFPEPGPKLIILATDGDPDRCEDPDGHDQISKDEATDAAQQAYMQGIETVIIAVGDQVSDEHQQDMANAGSGKPVPAPFPCDPNVDPVNCAPTYEPSSKQALIDTFTDIINGKRTCTFSLDGEVIPGKECDGTVKVNGVEIPCNSPDGWQLNSPTEIEFLGATCDTILNDPNVDIEAQFPCDSIVPPPN